MNPPHAQHGEGDRPKGGEGVVRSARQLRREMSLPEVMLWQHLRLRLEGIKFRRQHPVGRYVVDFYCARAKLAVEVDGEAHDRGGRPARDELREATLRSHGLHVVRVAASDILKDAKGVAEALVATAEPLHRPAGGPPPHASHGEDLAGAA